MGRGRRRSIGGEVYHVLNRGNDRKCIFKEAADYIAFLKVLREGREKARLEIYSYCIMPNHWHLVVRPERDEDLIAYMTWVTNTHVKRYHAHYQTTGEGHLYQGPYKNFEMEGDSHLLTVICYVEGNPRRGRLVSHAEDWPWSSLGASAQLEGHSLIDSWPINRPSDWCEIVNQRQSRIELDTMHTCIARGLPYGSAEWVEEKIKQLGFNNLLRPLGRPPKFKRY